MSLAAGVTVSLLAGAALQISAAGASSTRAAVATSPAGATGCVVRHEVRRSTKVVLRRVRGVERRQRVVVRRVVAVCVPTTAAQGSSAASATTAATVAAASSTTVRPTSLDWARGVTFGAVDNVGSGAVADCAVAAIADIEQLFAHKTQPVASAPYVDAYEQLAEAENVTPGPDGGLVPADVLATWETTGVAGTTISAATPVGLGEQAIEQALVKGPLYAVLVLPTSASTAPTTITSSDVAVDDWSATTPPSGYAGSGEHVVAVVGYDATDVLVATWGYVQPISWAVWSEISGAAWSVTP